MRSTALSLATESKKAATTIASTNVGVNATRSAKWRFRTSMSSYRVDTLSGSYLAGNIRTLAKSNAACRLSAKFRDAITRSPWHATAVSTTLNSSAMRSVVLYSPVVTLVLVSAPNAAHVRGKRSRRRSIRDVSNNADVLSRTASTLALSLVMEMKHASFASRYVTSSAATRSAQRSVASRARRAQKSNVHLAAHTPNAVCLVQLHAIGHHVRNAARSR